MLVVMRAAIGSPLRGRGARGSELVIHPSCLQHRPQCRRNRARLMTERIHFHDVCAKERDMHSRALAAETAADARGSWDRLQGHWRPPGAELSNGRSPSPQILATSASSVREQPLSRRRLLLRIRQQHQCWRSPLNARRPGAQGPRRLVVGSRLVTRRRAGGQTGGQRPA